MPVICICLGIVIGMAIVYFSRPAGNQPQEYQFDKKKRKPKM